MFQPLTDTGNCAFCCIGGRMRSVKHPDFTEQHHGNPGPRSFREFCSQRYEQRLNVFPWNVAAGRMAKNLLQRSVMLTLHVIMVLEYGTTLGLVDYNFFQ